MKVDIAEMRQRCYEPEEEAEVDVVQSKVIWGGGMRRRRHEDAEAARGRYYISFS